MQSHVRTFLAAGTVLVLAAACGDEDLTYPGGPPGSPATLALSDALFDLQAGRSVTLGVQLQDSAGNAIGTMAEVTSCDGSIAAVASGTATDRWNTVVTITAVGLGRTCTIASAAGIAETLQVRTGPAGIRVVGPDVVGSGEGGSYSVEFLAADGSVLTPTATFPIPELVSLQPARLPLSPTGDVTYDAAGQQPGAVTLEITTARDAGGVSAHKLVTVVPGTFMGTLSATSVDVQDVFVVHRGSNRTWDGDEKVRVGTKYFGDTWDGTMAGMAFAWHADSLVVYVPATVPAGSYNLVVVDQGPLQIAEGTPFTVTGAATTNVQPFPGTNVVGASIEDKPLPLRFPVVHLDPAVSTTTYYTVAPTGSDFIFTITLDWEPAGDLDIQFIDGDFTVFLGDRSGETLAQPEATVWGVEDGDFNFIRFQTFESVVIPAQATIFEGCVSGIQNGDGDAVQDTDNWDDWC